MKHLGRMRVDDLIFTRLWLCTILYACIAGVCRGATGQYKHVIVLRRFVTACLYLRQLPCTMQSVDQIIV